MKPQRVLVLVHRHLVPPDDVTGIDVVNAEWKTEYDVIHTLRESGHEVRPLGIQDELNPIRQAIDEWKPTIVFNLLEAFDNVNLFDQNVVSYLELLRIPSTPAAIRAGCCWRATSRCRRNCSHITAFRSPNLQSSGAGERSRCLDACSSRSS